ncbi:hypothetical protein PR003_g4458 [Phytophthora rubi]|uniref:Uncharacterized protein n=1 Tax=Phytophthora rubi TaxID=129364 RepID=A0A6A4FUY9_9STRA|nr:hypothetical protein PR002_g6216 [Phytophthora rubi]KAE9043345.1 hypothetical protein PR001_g5827 [Phytophthora rubi]KAE9352281.1 hypothetical protein PR003_g4458 [Phytophthora rubi]
MPRLRGSARLVILIPATDYVFSAGATWVRFPYCMYLCYWSTCSTRQIFLSADRKRQSSITGLSLCGTALYGSRHRHYAFRANCSKIIIFRSAHLHLKASVVSKPFWCKFTCRIKFIAGEFKV